MSKFALVEGGAVKEIFDKDPRLPSKITIPVAHKDGENEDGSPRFKTEMQDQEVPGWSSDLDIREIGGKVKAGWIVDDDGELSPPQPASVSLEDLPDVLIQAAEQEPIEVKGTEISIRDLDGLRNARDYLQASKAKAVKWRSGGKSTSLSIEDVESIITELVTRQQKYYDKYAELDDKSTQKDIEKAFASIKG